MTESAGDLKTGENHSRRGFEYDIFGSTQASSRFFEKKRRKKLLFTPTPGFSSPLAQNKQSVFAAFS
jgi:hypothetical protein